MSKTKLKIVSILAILILLFAVPFSNATDESATAQDNAGVEAISADDSAQAENSTAQEENAINEMKADWFNGVVHSLKFERMNRQRMIEADRIAEYDYLTKANKTLNRHKLALQLYADNGNKIPDDRWADLLG